MRVFLIIFLFFVNHFTAYGQQIGISGGYCMNHFYDFSKNDNHFKTEYTQGAGYGLNMNVDNVMVDTLSFRFSLNFVKYGGSFITSDGGLGGGSTTSAHVEKYVLGFAVFPLNFRIFKDLKISVGVEFNYLINSEVRGIQSSWMLGAEGKMVNLEDGTVEIFRKYNFGIINRIGYNILVYKRWYLIPEYDFYWGLTNEFENIEANVKSYRHSFMIGISNKFY